jgi:hypothetical protein
MQHINKRIAKQMLDLRLIKEIKAGVPSQDGFLFQSLIKRYQTNMDKSLFRDMAQVLLISNNKQESAILIAQKLNLSSEELREFEEILMRM